MDETVRVATRDGNLLGIVTAALRRGLETLAADELTEAHVAVRNLRWQAEDRILSERNDAFVASGGCAECDGAGTKLVWDTMDSMTGCYAEFGPCSNAACTEETRRTSGPNPARPKTYRGMSQNVKGDTFAAFPITPTEALEFAPIDAAQAGIEAELAARVIEVGKPVRVIRGFRVVDGKKKGRGALPLGLEGDVFWHGKTQYGTRVGIRVGEGATEIVWTSVGNVEVIR